MHVSDEALEKAAYNTLVECMALKHSESCLIITDREAKRIGEAYLKAAKMITSNADIIIEPIPPVSGTEPSPDTARVMKDYSVIMMPTTKSFSHTNARNAATKAGARIASMPSITPKMMLTAVDVDYKALKVRTKRMLNIVTKGKIIHITTEKGTDLTLSVTNSKWFGFSSGIYDEPGKWGNLPSGEAFCAPEEGTANGTLIVDGAMLDEEEIIDDIRFEIQNGFVDQIEGNIRAKKLKTILKGLKDPNAYNIAEFAIGTNDKATFSGFVLEEEKILGTIHIALGNNATIGGNVNAKIHLDGIITKPTVFIDNKMIIDGGKWLI